MFCIQCYVVINHFIQNSFLKSIIDLIKLIENCDYSLEGEEWKNVSEEGKDLVSKLIIMEPEKRLLPKDALNHDWFYNSFTSEGSNDYKINA